MVKWWFETPSRPLWRHNNEIWRVMATRVTYPMLCPQVHHYRYRTYPHRDRLHDWKRFTSLKRTWYIHTYTKDTKVFLCYGMAGKFINMQRNVDFFCLVCACDIEKNFKMDNFFQRESFLGNVQCGLVWFNLTHILHDFFINSRAIWML